LIIDEKEMKRIVDIVLSAVFLLYFGIILVVFHGIQWLAFNLFGAKAHQKTVNWLNFFIVYGWLLTGTLAKFKKEYSLPTDRPIVFIANHKSMFDIPGIIWYWRQHTPIFVSKKELAKGIPSISYNLRTGKAALIDRKDGKSAVVEIAKLSRHIHDNNYSAAIFPEGTRARTGVLKEFQVGGVAVLLKRCPNALVVPISVKGTYDFNPKGLFPLTSFSKVSYTSLKPIEPAGLKAEEIVSMAKSQIEQSLKNQS
jgi:1-acyl-sn-glycerol-3-phosphate acyltransferase